MARTAPGVRTAVDRYQSAPLMPAWLIRQCQTRYDLTSYGLTYTGRERTRPRSAFPTLSSGSSGSS